MAIDKEKIKVSVIMPVYNHEPYIAQAIEGVLMQKTDFKYELIIGEDCSTDNSRDIIRKYQKKYPNIIKVIYWKNNVGARKNIVTLKRMAKGDYCAICEGDDYWCHNEKLQKQVNFLEENPHYSAVYHNVHCVDETGRVCRRKSINKYPIIEQTVYNFDMIKGLKLAGQTASVVYRNLYHVLTKEQIAHLDSCDYEGDQKLCVVLTCIGKVLFMKDVMACHRVVLNHGDSWSARMQGKNQTLLHYDIYDKLCLLTDRGFGRDYTSESYEKTLCKKSLTIFAEKVSFSNFMICLQVHLKYYKKCVSKVFNLKLCENKGVHN